MFTYLNGEWVEASEAKVSVFDRGFMLGDGIFDCWRTYGTKTCRPMVEKHLKRLRQGLAFMEMPNPEPIVAEIDAASQAAIELNREEIAAVGDVWVWSMISRGAALEGDLDAQPTRVVMCRPLMFAGDLHVTGAHLVTSAMSQNPFGAVDPRVKSLSRMGYVRGERKVNRSGYGSWVVFFDNDGFITEASGAALCIIENDTIVTPPRWQILNSVSLSTFCELARGLGIGVEERPLTIYDYLSADAVYLLATSVGALPVADLDGIPLSRNSNIGERVLKRWVDYVGFDFIEQARLHGKRQRVR